MARLARKSRFSGPCPIQTRREVTFSMGMIHAVAIFLFILSLSADALGFRLPDTGQTKCYQDVDPYAQISCPAPGNPLAQDGSYSMNPRNLTDNSNGTVTDNNTGLMWQQCSAGQNNDSSCSGIAAVHNWYQATGTTDPFYNPSPAGFQDVCGTLSLAGYDDWRLPTRKELITIVDYSIPYTGPVVSAEFGNTQPYGYWSSTGYAGSQLMAWGVGFGDSGSRPDGVDLYGGDLYGSFKDNEGYVRCVRGTVQPVRLRHSSDTVTDTRTGLIWQKQDDGLMRTWGGALAYCEGLQLAGLSGWRLPNISELESTVDDSAHTPAANPVFTDTKAFFYWSSTTTTPSSANPDYADFAWDVDFSDGNVHGYSKDGADYARCVQSGALVTILSADGTVTSNPAGIVCGAECSAHFLKNSFVVFNVIPSADKAYSGMNCAPDFNPDGSISGDMVCTAAYSSCGAAQAARIGTASPDLILNTYAGASSAIGARDTIEIIGINHTIVELDFNLPLNVTLSGGYDCSFATRSSYTVFSGGKLTISRGSVVIDGIIIM